MTKQINDRWVKTGTITTESLISLSKSFGTLSFLNEDIKDILTLLKTRMVLNPDSKGIKTLINSVSNLKVQHILFDDKKTFKLLLDSYASYYLKQRNPGDIVSIAKNLAKIEHYDNKIFQILGDKFQVIMSNLNEKEKVEMAQLCFYMLYDKNEEGLPVIDDLWKIQKFLVSDKGKLAFQECIKVYKYSMIRGRVSHNYHRKVRGELLKR